MIKFYNWGNWAPGNEDKGTPLSKISVKILNNLNIIYYILHFLTHCENSH